jgi:uncharacterized RDD family membrane protein YckC
MTEVKETSKPSLPAWRIELNERVRAIKAQKEANRANELSSQSERVSETANLASGHDSQSVTSIHNSVNGSKKNGLSNVSIAFDAETQALNKHANNTILVEKALTRVKRASEKAMRSSLPRIEPARSGQAAASLALDREATARVLEPPILAPEEQIPLAPVSETKENLIIQRAQHHFQSHAAVSQETRQRLDTETEQIKQLDEEHLLDYLEAEVVKVDKKLHEQMGVTDSPDLYAHALINVIDLLVISLSCLPFFALMKIVGGSVFGTASLSASLVIIAMVSTFYLALTQFLCGRTFGMMAASSHIIDVLNNETPSLQMVLMRTVGYFISAAPAFAGFFWITLDPQHRGWHDKFSGTMVVRDF